MMEDFKSDPLRPYKMYVAMGAVAVSTFASDETISLNPYLKAVLIAIVAGIAVYFTPNPKVPK